MSRVFKILINQVVGWIFLIVNNLNFFDSLTLDIRFELLATFATSLGVSIALVSGHILAPSGLDLRIHSRLAYPSESHNTCNRFWRNSRRNNWPSWRSLRSKLDLDCRTHILNKEFFLTYFIYFCNNHPIMQQFQSKFKLFDTQVGQPGTISVQCICCFFEEMSWEEERWVMIAGVLSKLWYKLCGSCTFHYVSNSYSTIMTAIIEAVNNNFHWVVDIIEN